VEIVADLSERQKRTLPLEEGRHVKEAVVEATKHGEDEGTILDDLLEITESVGHPFESASVVEDG
jgi:hypothetical protein